MSKETPFNAMMPPEHDANVADPQAGVTFPARVVPASFRFARMTRRAAMTVRTCFAGHNDEG